MKHEVITQLDILLKRYPELSCQRNNILLAFDLLKECFENGGKLLIAGNGGSAADAEHMVGELMKGFENARPLSLDYQQKLLQFDTEIGGILARDLQGALPAIALGNHTSLSTAFMNDCNPELCFAQQVNGYGNEKDVLFCISTSGNSSNIIYAAVTAKAKNMKVIALTGANESKLSSIADVTIYSPQTRTYMIQEHHLPIYHALCLMLETHFFE